MLCVASLAAGLTGGHVPPLPLRARHGRSVVGGGAQCVRWVSSDGSPALRRLTGSSERRLSFKNRIDLQMNESTALV